MVCLAYSNSRFVSVWASLPSSFTQTWSKADNLTLWKESLRGFNQEVISKVHFIKIRGLLPFDVYHHAHLVRYKLNPYHAVLLTASPNPGVSTTVSFNFTPFSSMSTVCFVISTVWLMRSPGQNNKQIWILNQRVIQWLCSHCITDERNKKNGVKTSDRLVTHLQRWAAFCLYEDQWGKGCSPEWIYLGQTHL